MKVVFLIGNVAVGKMTVGQELMKRTGVRLFHNHMTIEPVLEIFGTYNKQTIHRWREVVFEEFAKTDSKGMIFTYVCAFDCPEDWAYLEHVREIFLREKPDAEFYYVELIAPQEVRLQRNETENRLNHKASKRNLEFSRANLLGTDREVRCVSEPGEIPYKNYLRLENAEIPAEKAAEIIQNTFSL